ncbi:membrane protein [Salmonella enterica subsp. arizonae]|uniref:Membrane protein n=1 Tax=Salmonella enterica subsp. arizonae TaxID=59203 RepID=A0A379SFJ7_SALER|nr:membrane protein [Salmonella enterica subsp. arizonae]
MQVEDYMNETPLRLLEMLTQTRKISGARRRR